MKSYENYTQIMHNTDYEFANVYEVTRIFGFAARKRALTVCVAKRAPYDLTGFVILTDGNKASYTQAYGINLARHVAELRAALETQQKESHTRASIHPYRAPQTITINGED
jgi:hypothetical protein